MTKGAYRLNIIMVVPGMPFDGDTLKERSLGGSETAGLCMARELAARGHDVTMFSNCGHEREIDGVAYANITRATEVIQKVPHDVLIVQRAPEFFGFSNVGKLNVLWNHDLATKGMFPKHQAAAWNIDWVFLLSRFHVEQAKGVYSFLDDDHIRQTRNGIDLQDFPAGVKKIRKKCMYAARPERGLVNLVGQGGIMEMLLQVDPQIHLYVAGYDNTVPEMAGYYQNLWERCDALSNVTRLGCLTKKELYRHYAEAELYLYPTAFEEISCITAMECMAAGAVMVTSRHGALPETLGDKASVLLDLPRMFEGGVELPLSYRERFAGEVIGLLSDKDRLRLMAYQGRERAKGLSWAGVAEEWEGLFMEHFSKASQDRHKLARHFLYFDDVVAAKKLADEHAYEDIHEMIGQKCGWAFDVDSHARHYEEFGAGEWENRPPDHVADHFDHVFVNEPRWHVTQNILRELKIGPGKAILDVGCCCGWFAVGMANAFGCDVVGIDVCDTYIHQAGQLAQLRLRDGKCEFMHETNPEWQRQQYDVIYIAEVLEHLAYVEPTEFVKQFEQYLKPDGNFVTTTPYGPLRRLAARGSGMHHDLHVRHLERADLEEMFGGKGDFSCEMIYWQHSEATQEACGWNLCTFGKSGRYGTIDYDRKFFLQAPRDTLSVCMIARDEEAIIRRALNSVREIADEIIVVDTGSKDRTPLIAQECGAKVIAGSNPLEHGFEQPRNESIQAASGDWILWIDADEELQGESNLRKYLRNSIYRGFRIRQQHFTCQPIGSATIDKPVRVFRKDPRVRFYGLVHEHPGYNENDGCGLVIELADVDIAHSGYYTEPKRRAKFWRNLPLMMQDIKKYPNRFLGRWLYMRDLMHLSQWAAEQTGGMTEKARDYCREVVQLYRNNFLSMGGHMMVDGLPYYSGALRALGRGQDFNWLCGNAPRVDRFEDIDDFRVFQIKILEETTWMSEGKYAR